MILSTRVGFYVAALLALVLVATLPADAASPIRMTAATSGQSFSIAKGVPQMIVTTTAFSEIVVGDPALADAWPLTDKSFMVLGSKGGVTGIVLFDKERNVVGAADFEIALHTDRLQAALERKLPDAKVDVSSANGSIVLSGVAADQKTIDEAGAIAKEFGGDKVVNAVDIGGGKQVQLKVRFLEATRSASRELGLGWAVQSDGFAIGVGSSTLASGSTPFGEIVSQVLSGGLSVDMVVQALEARGLARSLAEPNLVALSGQTSSFLAGGEFPVPVASDNNSVSVEFKKFGVGLDFTPTVAPNGLIHLNIKPEVSEIDYSAAVTINSITIPGLKVRRSDSTLELRDGQSFVIAGLLTNSRSVSNNRVPWLGSVPVLGNLFRSTAYKRSETDLVIIVTPHIVDPLGAGTAIATPFDRALPGSDLDAFARGNAEVPPDPTAYLAANGASTGGYILDLVR
ncbi:type II and III secretion system protein family protein [Pleomorphomonas sp. NRK KF1]|uniref:type II and III secretion system protein family protein n=1 Tax=Pleomorphomonas sp. NRK KF1 TaxID=2943000 RepID=UPI002042E164|nr:type II and III secretion system protein family protein [Pleomorphomonas sp. NRK KF1]MCM5553792.1 type II and III secretion system protein family protein [Pleomorphomonas sp. NRK KF1]